MNPIQKQATADPSPEGKLSKAGDPTSILEEKPQMLQARSRSVTPLTQSNKLRGLLNAFDARALGEGDEVTGANLLAAMAIALANIARPGSGFQTPAGRIIPVNCNLLASGAQLTNMIQDEVVTPVGSCQNNILAHVDRLVKNDEEQNQRQLRNLNRKWTIPNDLGANHGESIFFQLMTADPKNNLLAGDEDAAWLNVVSIAPHRNFLDLVRSPRAFVVAANPAMLDRQLGGFHSGQALITIALNLASDAGKFGSLCTALMNGTIPLGPSGEIIRGQLLVTDPGNVLPEAAKEAADECAWLGRLVWLVSGNAGPEPPPESSTQEKVVCLPQVAARFEYAAQNIFAKRMNGRNPQPLILKEDFTENQLEWMTFLRDMESRLPGISGTARHLLASLTFGLRQIVGAEEQPEGFKYHMSGIKALARFLVWRMANARAAMLYSAEEASKQRSKQRILTKLSDGSLETRAIYHPLHLTAATCGDILLDMESENLVKRRGRKWELVTEVNRQFPPEA